MNSDLLADLIAASFDRVSVLHSTDGPVNAWRAAQAANTLGDSFPVEIFEVLDDVSTAIGLARVETKKQSDCARVDAMLLCVQNDLLGLCADLCEPRPKKHRKNEGPNNCQARLDRLERWIGELHSELPLLESVVLPGGSAASATLYLARSLVRRSERLLVNLLNVQWKTADRLAFGYVHRLSYLLFLVARYLNNKGESDILWDPGLIHTY
jgi:cob(I)alamin adenosyltransferase